MNKRRRSQIITDYKKTNSKKTTKVNKPKIEKVEIEEKKTPSIENTLFGSNDIPHNIQEYIDREEVVETPEVVEDKNESNETKNNDYGYYFSFNARLITNIIVLLVLIGSFIYTVAISFSTTKNEIIKYNVRSNMDYKVYLKKNDFYDEEYLGKGMAYVASLIDKIDIDYNYNFNVDKKSDIDFTYKVVAKLVISSQNNNSVFFEKEYDLTEEMTKEILNQNTYTIKENIKVNYVYYNNLANRFRANYAVNTNSRLDVYLVVNEKSKENNSYDLRNESKVLLTIPLSLQEVNIKLDGQDINEDKELVIVTKGEFNAYSIFMLVVILVFMVIVVIELVKKLMLVTNKKSRYDTFVDRILRGYDRIIVTVTTMPNFDDYNIFKVANFQELIDVRDNLKLPINYFVITEHHKCEFYVINNKEVYLYVVKAVDLDGEYNDKESASR